MEPEPDPFTNIKKVDGGFLLTDENIIALANYIQELQFKNQQLEAENSRLQNQVDALDKALQEERAIVDKLHEINMEDAHPCPPECNRNNPCPRCRLSEQIINPLWFALWF